MNHSQFAYWMRWVCQILRRFGKDHAIQGFLECWVDWHRHQSFENLVGDWCQHLKTFWIMNHVSQYPYRLKLMYTYLSIARQLQKIRRRIAIATVSTVPSFDKMGVLKVSSLFNPSS